MTHETVPTNRRIYMVMQAMPGGMMQFRLSAMPPHYDDPAAVLLVRGVLPQGDDVVLQIVSDPSANPSLRGKDGKDGTNGTNGTNGRDGVDGKNGADGKAGSNGLDGKAGTNGVDGQSAYDIARSLGYGGTKTQWLAALIGAAGKDGKDGANGTDGRNASALLGTVNLTQTATAAISAGTRRLVLTIPTTWAVVAGDPLMALPSVAIAGYAVHDVVAVSPTSISVGFTAPLLAIGASFTIPLRIARLNT